jgi:hypothetical protein
MDGIQHLLWVWIKRDDDARAPKPFGQTDGRPDEALVGDMNAVEHPDRDHRPCWGSFQRGQAGDDAHVSYNPPRINFAKRI